jgi:hypothetical protein
MGFDLAGKSCGAVSRPATQLKPNIVWEGNDHLSWLSACPDLTLAEAAKKAERAPQLWAPARHPRSRSILGPEPTVALANKHIAILDTLGMCSRRRA